MNTSQTYKYAGFWWRFLATALDLVILTILTTVMGGVAGGLLGLQYAAHGVPLDAQTEASFRAAGFLAGVTTQWLYYTLFESSRWQATPGEKMCGLLVTDTQGGRIGFGKANGRYWGSVISALLLCIGFLMIGWTKRKQGLHDKMAGTLVLRRLGSARDRVVLPDAPPRPPSAALSS